MNATLQTLFQYLTDPCDLADSVSAFIQSRSEKLKPTVEALSGVIDGSITPTEFAQNTAIYHKWSLSLLDDGSNGEFIDLDDLVTSMTNAIDLNYGDPDIEVINLSGEVISLIPLSTALDRIHSLVSESEMLTTALNIAQQVADGDTNEFLVNSFAKIDGYLQGTDLSTKLKGIFTSIYEEIRENVQDPTYLVESILVHFGMIGDNSDPRKNDVSDYTGQSARCVLFMDAAEKLGWVIGQLPTAASYVVGFVAVLVTGVQKLLDLAYKGIQKLTYKALAHMFELGDGIQKTILPGRGYIKHPGFSVTFDGTHTSFPTGEYLANVYSGLNAAIGDVASQNQQYSIPIGPIVIYVDWKVNKASITYDIKPIDYKIYRQVYYEHFNAYPYFSVKSVGGSIFQDSTGENLTGKTRVQLLSFVQDLYSRNNVWGMEYDFDSDRYMCIQAAKHLSSIIYALADDQVNTIDSTLASECVDACIYIDVTKEIGYRSDTQSFIPENVNFASLCTMMGTRNFRVDCFYSYLNESNDLDFTDNSILSQISSIDCHFIKILGEIAYRTIGNDPLSVNSFFVPYFHKFKLYRPSYYIPTDSDNVDYLRKMIVTGLVVVAVVAVVVTAVYLGAKFRKKKWMMEQQAAQKAFTASETGNAALLQDGWKLQKRVNLLGILSGSPEVVATPITSGVTTALKNIKGDQSGVTADTTLLSIKQLITG